MLGFNKLKEKFQNRGATVKTIGAVLLVGTVAYLGYSGQAGSLICSIIKRLPDSSGSGSEIAPPSSSPQKRWIWIALGSVILGAAVSTQYNIRFIDDIQPPEKTDPRWLKWIYFVTAYVGGYLSGKC